MSAGSDVLWSLADRLQMVPSPPDPALQVVLDGWLAAPKRFGCVTARRHPERWLNVLYPHPEMLCAECLLVRLDTAEPICCYCGRRCRPSRADLLLYEVDGWARVFSRRHRHCSEKIEKAIREASR